MRVYRGEDADLGLIRGKKIALIGYGSQGRAHALNMRDSGVDGVVIGLHSGSTSAAKAKAAGFAVMTNAEAAKDADIVVMAAPDQVLPDVYAKDLAPTMKKGAALLFIHGFAIHFGFIKPRADLDVLMVAPAGPGTALRSGFLEGNGLIGLLAVHSDISGKTKQLGVAYGAAIGCGVGMIETDFRSETETDLFGEQSVLCGGSVELIKAGFDTLVEAGYAPELAYFECLHQLKLIVDLVHARGIKGMYGAISDTAEFGARTRGPRAVGEATRREMKRILEEVQNGKFANELMNECRTGQPKLKAMRAKDGEQIIEKIGAELRALMPWIGKSKAT